jgi:hypothetical protein
MKSGKSLKHLPHLILQNKKKWNPEHLAGEQDQFIYLSWTWADLYRQITTFHIFGNSNIELL